MPHAQTLWYVAKIMPACPFFSNHGNRSLDANKSYPILDVSNDHFESEAETPGPETIIAVENIAGRIRSASNHLSIGP